MVLLTSTYGTTQLLTECRNQILTIQLFTVRLLQDISYQTSTKMLFIRSCNKYTWPEDRFDYHFDMITQHMFREIKDPKHLSITHYHQLKCWTSYSNISHY